jgi:hypothetical protein
MSGKQTCPDCGVSPGEFHVPGCDVERCTDCGHQAIGCDCPLDEEPAHPRLPWTGEFPGVAECREYGLWARTLPGKTGSHPCKAGTPGAAEDLITLVMTCVWDADAARWRKR